MMKKSKSDTRNSKRKLRPSSKLEGERNKSLPEFNVLGFEQLIPKKKSPNVLNDFNIQENFEFITTRGNCTSELQFKEQTMTIMNKKQVLNEENDLVSVQLEKFEQLRNSIQELLHGEILPTNNNENEHLIDINGSIELRHACSFNEFQPDILKSSRKHHGRSVSEVDLSRKLCESYDMQERLVADNADLEVKRYVLYKELVAKEQNLETYEAQVKRLQGEMSILTKENQILKEKLSKNHPEGDASIVHEEKNLPKQNTTEQSTETEISLLGPEKYIKELSTEQSTETESNLLGPDKYIKELVENFKDLEAELNNLKGQMDHSPGSACRRGNNPCFQQSGGPPVPPMTKSCGVCPPCPAPCNPNAPPTPAEKEVVKLTLQLRQTEENFKTKITECAVLRADLVHKKEELEKERCQHKQVQTKLRELEMKFEGLTAHTNMLLGTKEQALETEVNVRTLKQCYREAKEEIDELRTVLKEQNEQIQEYRSKYLQAQQLVEEQRRQMDMMDMDNTRISEQINLEIQRVKLKFQEKLQELAPIPDLLKATQARLKDAQQSQAIAEHNAEQLARELNCAREKVHALLHNSLKSPEKVEVKSPDDKTQQLLQQRITQLTENNVALKTEVDRLKANVIRMEEAVLANEKRLQEKIHECAVLGGELDRARDEAARALERANERTDTIRKCLQTTVAELERQLAASRAQVKTAEKERHEVQARMNCQISRLNENFEQAQLRILGLQTQVSALRKTVSSTFEEEDGAGECACKQFFENP